MPARSAPHSTNWRLSSRYATAGMRRCPARPGRTDIFSTVPLQAGSIIRPGTNAEFHLADLSKPLDPTTLPWLKESYSHVLLDPPRAGASEVLASISRLNPRRVLYISCHPGSLARDLGLLVHEHGMSLVAAGVLDMFPHTTHVESLAILEPAKRKGRSP